jgi:hypothetical protein
MKLRCAAKSIMLRFERSGPSVGGLFDVSRIALLTKGRGFVYTAFEFVQTSRM